MKILLAAAAAATFAITPAFAVTTTFTNATPVAIPDAGETTTSITTTGLTGSITGLSVRLNGLSHTYPDDLVFGLVNQTAGLGFVFFSGAGGSTDIVNVNLTFSDTAATQLPESFVGGGITSGTYLPSNYLDFEFINFTNATSFADFNGLAANALWTLYIDDIASLDTGSLSGGFSLIVTTADAPAVPEPMTWAMMALGFGVVGGAMRARRRNAAEAVLA